MNDKDKITALISLLGEENANRIKEKVADFIIEAMQDDIQINIARNPIGFSR